MAVALSDSLKQDLEKYRQQHVLRFLEELDPAAREAFLEQLAQVDLIALDHYIQQAIQKAEGTSAAAQLRIEPLTEAIRLPQTPQQEQEWAAAREQGRQMLDTGKVGAILVAGGQGSRLGFPHPKGMFPVGPVTDRTLFQIFFEQLLALSNRHGVKIPYFIMTSAATHQETLDFLREHAWFGYPEEDVFLFQQGTLPAVDDQTGQLLLAEKSSLAMSPDGHGGLLQALQKAGLLEEMQRRGIETLFYHQVDNPCVKMCDPAMLGFHQQAQAEISTKVVAKRDASEKVGVLAELNGKQGIIEYSDLSEAQAQQQDEAGGLLYWAGNIAIHIFNRSLLERLTTGEAGLPIHIAHKKVPYLNEQGEAVSPDTPNAFKFEKFIFDAIPLANKALVIETSREEEFNPVKNAEGQDSPATSREALLRQAQRWLQQAGHTVPAELRVEISPLVALEPEDLCELTLPEMQDSEWVLTPDHQE